MTRKGIGRNGAAIPAALVAVVLLASACSATSSPLAESTTVPPEDLTTTSLRTDPGGTVADTADVEDVTIEP